LVGLLFISNASRESMFAEELGGNTNRRRQEEQRRRRRQAKLQKKKEETEKARPESLQEKPDVVPQAIAQPKPPPSTPSESADSKPTVVSNALQLRAERQAKQKLDKSARKLQSFYRMHRSNSKLLQTITKTLEKHITDLEKLQLLLNKNSSRRTYVPPTATSTALCQQLLFVTTSLPYKNQTRSVSLRDLKVTSHLLRKAIELVFLPGISDIDDSSNAFSEWLQSLQGQVRVQNFLRLCLCVLTTSCEDAVQDICRQFILSMMTSGTQSSTPSTAIDVYRNLLLPVSTPRLVAGVEKTSSGKTTKPLFFWQLGSPLDVISVLRHFLLFSTGGGPIPSMANDIGESCIKAEERGIASCLMLTILKAIRGVRDSSERHFLLQRLLTEIYTIPLLSWRVTTDCLLFKDSLDQSKLLVATMIKTFTERFSDTLNTGKIQSLFPIDVSLTICNATPMQSLLANLMQIGHASVGLNGMDVSKLDFAMSATFYEFVATLIDAIPLGTLSTKDSVVEWFSDGKGRETCVLLSPVVMRQCRMVLSSSIVRRLFLCAIDEESLKTKEVLSSKTQKDLKQEKELEEAGPSAVSLAAKEAKIDRSKSFWRSSTWAKKASIGVSKMLSGETAGAKGNLQPKQPQDIDSNRFVVRSKYSPALLMVLCRLYGIVIARWGGFGGEDSVKRVQKNEERKARPVATRMADVGSQSLLNVICFSTNVTETTWGMLQGEKDLTTSINAVVSPTKEKLPVRCLSIRPRYGKEKQHQTRTNAVALLFLFVSSLSHTLIITDDTEVHEMEKPLPLHQLRRCVELLKQLLYRACCVDDVGDSSTSVFQSDYFGLALINSTAKAMRDLYDRSSRRPISTPKLWLIEDLLEKEIKKSKTEQDFVALLSTPVLRICPFLVSFKRRLKLFDRIVYKNRIAIQGENSTNPFHTNPLKPGIPVRITRGRILEDGVKTMNNLGTNMRQRIAVQYYNEAGTKEVGIDAGGLFKEFWTDLSTIAFDPGYSLFRMTEDNCMYPSPLSKAAHGLDHIVLFEFLGRILGKGKSRQQVCRVGSNQQKSLLNP